MLRDIVVPSLGTIAGVEAWKGPEGMPQDYILAGGALEVKCTRAKAGTRIPIANEMQLDERPFNFLTLIHIAVTLAGGGPSISTGAGIRDQGLARRVCPNRLRRQADQRRVSGRARRTIIGNADFFCAR